MAARTDGRDFLLFVPVVKRSAAAIEMTLPEFKPNARLSFPFRQPVPLASKAAANIVILWRWRMARMIFSPQLAELQIGYRKYRSPRIERRGIEALISVKAGTYNL